MAWYVVGWMRAYLATQGSYRVVYWERGTGREARSIQMPRNNLLATRWYFMPSAVEQHEDGTLLAAAYPRTIVIFNKITGQLLQEFRGHQGGVQRLRFVPQTRQLVSASDDGTCILWELKP